MGQALRENENGDFYINMKDTITEFIFHSYDSLKKKTLLHKCRRGFGAKIAFPNGGCHEGPARESFGALFLCEPARFECRPAAQ